MKIFKKILFIYLCILSNACASDKCPIQKVGVVEIIEASNKIYYSTFAVKFEGVENQDKSIALSEARIEARKKLLNYKELAHFFDGKLKGVLNISECYDGTYIYSTVAFDQKKYKQAADLQSRVDPTYHVNENTENKNIELKFIFDKLMQGVK